MAGRPGGRQRNRPSHHGSRGRDNEIRPWLKESRYIPPPANAAFAPRMEDVLDVYAGPHAPRFLLVSFDKVGKEPRANMRPPRPSPPGHAAWEGVEYARRGTANLFLLCAPLPGERRVTDSERRTWPG